MRPVVEFFVGSEDDTASWTIPMALLIRHSDRFHDTTSNLVKEESSVTTKITLSDRTPAIFQIFVQWLYFDTIPDRFGLSRLSTGGVLSNGFLLWTLGGHLQVGAFKDRIMRELYFLHSLDGYTDAFRLVEFTSAEIDYCWSNTQSGSKLRAFILDTFSQHLVYDDYIRMNDENGWPKLFTKHSDLQVQIISTIARSPNIYSPDVTEVVKVDTYLEASNIEKDEKEDTGARL
ncbi:hypothetical protein N0V95_001142 [Ascochyta clinopodiicola]|nr:hypothetical protein N0V95_001142 [Ascochyta clinopodiicola]